MKRCIFGLAAASLSAGCAQEPDNLSASYVSSMQYSQYGCSQLAAEAQRINARASELAGKQRKAANRDAALTTASVILFRPAAFFIPGADHADELARLRGEAEAIQRTATSKNCSA